jgi:hypothetical protein
MSKVYTTEELIQILADERNACINGKRLNLAASPSQISPVIDMFLQTDGIQKFTAYNDFRAMVHRYQHEHQVSGLVWQTLTINGQSLRFPRIDDQLIALADDLQVLRHKKASVLSFWRQATVGMDLYLSMNGGKAYQPIAMQACDRMIHRTEWAILSQQGSGEMLELILQLGWGKPEVASYRRGFPESGSEYIHAVYPKNRPLG